MSFRDAVALELRVAVSPTAQPLWLRILKWAFAIGAAVYFWRARYFWWVILALVLTGVGVHLLWRMKTKRWTQPWGGWNDLAAARGVSRK